MTTNPMPQPPILGRDELVALETWLGVNSDEDEHPLNKAGTVRNVYRNAEAWGPILVCLLSARGWLDDGGNPHEALERLLDAANRKAVLP